MKKETLAVVIVIILISLFKLFAVLHSAYPSYDTYQGLLQAEHVHKTGLPLIQDEQSYQGRLHLTGFLFSYVAYISTLFFQYTPFIQFAGILFSAISLVLIYIIAKILYTREWIPFFVVLLAAFSPIFFVSDLNAFTPETVFTPIFLLLLYYFISIDKITVFKTDSEAKKNSLHKKRNHHVILFLTLFLIAIFITSLTLLLLVGILVYLLFLRLEHLKVRKLEVELLFFISLFSAWFHILVYKKLFVQYGLQAVWINIPRDLLFSMFRGLTISSALLMIGILPFLFGIYAMYSSLFDEKRRRLLLLTALAISFFVFAWLGFVPLDVGIFYSTLLFVLLSGFTFIKINVYIEKTIMHIYKPFFIIGLFILVFLHFAPLFFSMSSVTVDQTPTQDQIDTMYFIQEQISSSATILGPIEEGHLLAYEGGVKTHFDMNFILAPDVGQRYMDAKQIYYSQSLSSVVDLLHYRDISYIYISPNTKKTYQIDQQLFSQSTCFKKIYSTKTTSVYALQC